MSDLQRINCGEKYIIGNRVAVIKQIDLLPDTPYEEPIFNQHPRGFDYLERGPVLGQYGDIVIQCSVVEKLPEAST